MERYILSPDIYPERLIRLWRHQHHFQRSLVGFGSANHMILASLRLLNDAWVLPESGRPQALMSLRIWWYELALWVVTNILFRYTDRFLCLRRPGRAYQLSVYAIVFAAPVPLLVMHVWTIFLAARYDSKTPALSPGISLWSAVVAFVTLLPIHAFYIRMARRFLLVDNDEKYEPIRPKKTIGYRDDPAPLVSSSPQAQSYLHDAWMTSLEARQYTQTMSTQTTLESQTPATGSEATANAAALTEHNTTPVVACPADHCLATGYVDAMPYTLRGLQGWLRSPLTYVSFALYMAFLTWKMVALIRAKISEPQMKYE